MINACRECQVKRLIYNSPADIVFEIGRDIQNGDESLPYAGKVSISDNQFLNDIFDRPFLLEQF